MSKVCASCGMESGDEFRFCAGCGGRFPEATAPSSPLDATLVVRQTAPSPPGRREEPPPIQPSPPFTPMSPPSARESPPPDATLVVRSPQPSSPPQRFAPRSIERSTVNPGRPGASAGPVSAPDSTLVSRAPAPAGAVSDAPPPTSKPATSATPQFDTGIHPDEPAAGDATIGAFEVQLLERPAPRARQVALLRRGEHVYVLHYRGTQAAVRMSDGRAGFLPRRALAAAPPAPEHDAPEETFAILPNVASIRSGPVPLRVSPSRLAPSLRELPGAELVQLQTVEAFFARVRLLDGIEGYVERDQLGMGASAPVLAGQIPLRTWAVGASALLCFIGALLPWFGSSTAGVDGIAGWLVILFAIAGVAMLFAPRSFPQIPTRNLQLAGAATGALVILTTIIATANHGGAIQFGPFLTFVAGIALGVAPWADELSARMREGRRT